MFEKQAFKLLEWFERHEAKEGYFTSNAHHPIWGVENSYILPHVFHYYGIILSYLNLYKNLKKEKYLKKAITAGNTLCKLQKWSGQFKFDTFEFNTKKPTGLTLIHNALPSIALLKLYQASNEKRFLAAAKKNIGWFFCRLWNGRWLTGCVNQDMCAAEALALLYTIEKKKVHRVRAIKIAEKMLQLQIKEGNLAGGFLRGFNEKKLVIPWYDAKTAVAYYHIYELLGITKYKDVAKATAKFLIKNSTKMGLTHWFIQKEKWEKVKTPYLIASAATVLYLCQKLNLKCDKSVVTTQQSDGSFPNATDYADARAIPNLGWNQFMLLYLTSLVEKEVKVTTKEKERINKKEAPSEAVIEGKLIALNKEGYVDVIKDDFVIKGYKIKGAHFKIPLSKKDKVKLRFRLVNSRWKSLRPSTRFLKVIILPYWIIKPYVLLEEISTFMARSMFDNRGAELIMKLKVWRK